jgi:hypothetical protein
VVERLLGQVGAIGCIRGSGEGGVFWVSAVFELHLERGEGRSPVLRTPASPRL